MKQRTNGASLALGTNRTLGAPADVLTLVNTSTSASGGIWSAVAYSDNL